jgi:limonene-1,2-epoxide hydrolase
VARDAAGSAALFTVDGTWQNVPNPPAVGRAGIEAMLAPILGRSERVRWDVVSASYEEHRCWLERVDRFWIDGVEYAVQCNGVVEIDPASGLMREWRDYVDITDWRTRLAKAGPLR